MSYGINLMNTQGQKRTREEDDNEAIKDSFKNVKDMIATIENELKAVEQKIEKKRVRRLSDHGETS